MLPSWDERRQPCAQMTAAQARPRTGTCEAGGVCAGWRVDSISAEGGLEVIHNLCKDVLLAEVLCVVDDGVVQALRGAIRL